MAENNETISPKPTPMVTMDFPDAIRQVMEGKKIARLSWEDKNVYGYMHDDKLMLWMNGEHHTWIISDSDMFDGDMFCKDWVVVQ